jgi:DNA-directed RNA polymerase specialized sigma24 family protein
MTIRAIPREFKEKEDLPMHISWTFLDKQKAAISALEAYTSMEYILRHSAEEENRIRVKMEGVGSPNLDGLPHAHNPQAAEERMLNCIEEIDVIKERYRQAVEYMAWFKPAWNQLPEDERYVLELFYMDDCNGAADRIADHFGIERKSAYIRKYRAIEHLSILLYGKY